ncbi:MAG: hypothetical protein KatS3mg096_401 [Candidatus Parcubacteria bacterium]|nr:MAG: hypothetical protein KatS3mg096_401 [Candidatus Parcubacteria bacterium]
MSPEGLQMKSVETLEKEKRLEILPERQRRIYETFLDSIDKIKTKAHQKIIEFKRINNREPTRDELNSLFYENPEFQKYYNFTKNVLLILDVPAESIIRDLVMEGKIETTALSKDYKKAVDTFYYLLLTSTTTGEINEDEIKKQLRNLTPETMERIGNIWENNSEGLLFNFSDLPDEEVKKLKESAGEVKMSIETDKDFIFLEPKADFWLVRWKLEKEPEEASFATELLKAAEKMRQLDERLSKVKFPKEVRDVLLEKDEVRRNEKLENINKEDAGLGALIRIILNIEGNLKEIFEKIKSLKELEKTTSPEELARLREDIRNKFQKEIESYEKAIEELEKRYGTSYQLDKEISKRLHERIGSWFKEKGPIILSGLGLWGLAIGWFLPLGIIAVLNKYISENLLKEKR